MSQNHLSRPLRNSADRPIIPFQREVKPRYTESPNPEFSYGQKVSATEDGQRWLEGETAGWKVIDPANEDIRHMHALLLSAIIPRPIALVSSIAADGTENLAPFSWFNTVIHNPPIISISVAATRHGRLKDTGINILATKNFTVSIISEPWVDNTNVTAMDTPADVGEWPLTGLTKEPSLHVTAARVKESAFSMECELFQAIDINHPDTGKHTATLILGRVLCFHVRNDVLNERGLVDFAKMQAVGRLGDISYARVGDAYGVPRPLWNAESEKAQDFLGGSKETATSHI